jgi:hypothetical protein
MEGERGRRFDRQPGTSRANKIELWLAFFSQNMESRILGESPTFRPRHVMTDNVFEQELYGSN